MKPIAPLLLLIAAASVRLEASIVTMAVSPARIVVAADSRVRMRDVGGEVTESRDTACKIWQRGDTFIAAAGVVSEADAFDIQAVIPDVLAQSGTARDRFVSLVKALYLQPRSPLSPLRKIMLMVASYAGKRGPDVAVGVVPVEALDILRSPAEPTACTGTARCGNMYVAAKPDRGVDDIAASERFKRGGLTEGETIDLMRDVIGRQAALTPDSVGGPVDVLVLDARGPRWVARKPECR